MDELRYLRMIGARIHSRRIDIGMTQKELAGEVGLSVSGVQKYEQGKRSFSLVTAQKIARVIGVGMSFFDYDIDVESHAVKVIDADTARLFEIVSALDDRKKKMLRQFIEVMGVESLSISERHEEISSE